MINASALEYGAVMNALQEHGPLIQDLYVEDNTAVLTFSQGDDAVMSTKGRRAKTCRANTPEGVSTVTFTVDATDGYVRFDVADRWESDSGCVCSGAGAFDVPP